MGITTSKWDADKYLDRPEMICEYLKPLLEEVDTDLFMAASKGSSMSGLTTRPGTTPAKKN